MKKLIAGLGMAALVLVYTSAPAATIDGVSDSSSATSSASWLIKVLLKNFNNADINNDVSASASSGGNSFTSADDQSNTSVTTGDANSATLVENTANTNMVSEEYDSSNGVDNAISNVSDSSTAETLSDDTLDNDIENFNEVAVDNFVDADSETGANAVVSGDSLNGASASTGNSGAVTGVITSVNLNIKDILRHLRFGP